MKIRAAVLNKMGAEVPYEKSRPLTIEDFDLDDPGRGEVMVKIGAAGLCHSDLSVVDGNRPRPGPAGHGAAGPLGRRPPWGAPAAAVVSPAVVRVTSSRAARLPRRAASRDGVT